MLRGLLNVLTTLVRPRGSRGLILGVCVAVGGIAGAVRTLSAGGGLLTGVALLALGATGVCIAVACMVDYGKR